jgi:HTH-type transcriptional regulator/antitoxin HigA
MAIEKRVYSDLPIPPGEYLAEVLAAKGMAQAELARRIGRPIQAVNEIIKGEKAITPATAIQLERALDVPAHIWTGLESRYQLIKARLEERKHLQKESTFLPRTPYKQLADLDYVERTRDSEHKIRELHRFYGVSSLAYLSEIKAYQASFRCGATREASRYALAAWLRCAELRAVKVPAEPFDKRKLRGALGDIRALSTKGPDEFMPKLERLLSQCGVVLVLLPHFPKTYAHGATFWIRPDKAVLLMSIRGKWADIFWFSLFHEIGHILLRQKKTYIDDGSTLPELVRQEKEADQFAKISLIGAESFDKFIRNGDFGEAAVKALAREVGISEGIVVGRLQYEGLLKYDSELNRIRDKYVWKVRGMRASVQVHLC